MADPRESARDSEALGAFMAERLDRFATRFVGLSAGMVVGDDRAIVSYGRASTAVPMPNEGISFQIGSVTKVFTALLLADAVRRDEVAIEQPVDSLIPDMATHTTGRSITLLDLATHSSGLPRLPPGLRRQALRNRSDPYADFTTEQLAHALTRTPKRPPGTKVRYSNYGFGVLGEALARASGMPYGTLVRSRIAWPLEMPATGAGATAGSSGMAEGHSRRGRPVEDWHLPSLLGAGALRSTVGDLLTFLSAHLTPERHDLQEALRLTLEPRLPAGRHLRIALGWLVLERKKGDPLWWHNGGTGGFFSFVGLDPALQTGVVVLANSARPVDRLGMALLEPRNPDGGGTGT